MALRRPLNRNGFVAEFLALIHDAISVYLLDLPQFAFALAIDVDADHLGSETIRRDAKDHLGMASQESAR